LPTNRGSRCVPPAPGMSPSATSGWPNFAVSTAILMVHAIAVSQPPPSAKPLTAAITGFAEVLDEIEDFLPETAGLLGLERGHVRELADVGAGDERLVAGSR